MIQTTKRCGVFGCDRPEIAKGLCDLHYRRVRRHGHIDVTRPKDWGKRSSHSLYLYWKQIRRNGVPLCEFWHKDFWQFVADVQERPDTSHNLYRPDKSLPMGPDNAIWSTSKGGPAIDAEHDTKRKKGQTHQAAYLRRRRAQDPLFDFKNDLKKAHGITIEDFERMMDAQGGICAICGRSEHRRSTSASQAYRLAVDHCHAGNGIRGLLCSFCNHAIGYLEDSPALLQRAIDYLRDPPAAKLGITHSGKHRARRLERPPSPYHELRGLP
jgi:hypothetical protein